MGKDDENPDTRLTAVSGNGALSGTWTAVDATVSGSDAPQVIGQRLPLSGDRFRITKDGAVLYGGRYSVNPDASPQTIRFDQSETEKLAGVWLGIYEVKDEMLTICDNSPDMTRPRPEGFADGAEAGYIVVRFRRES